MSTPMQQRRLMWKNRSAWKDLKSRYGTVGFARKVKATVLRLNEKKYSAVYLRNEFNAISNAWVEYDFSNITQGDDIFGNRQGRRIMVTEFFLYGVIQGGQSNIATDDAFNVVRIVGTFSSLPTPLTTGTATIDDIVGKRMDAEGVYKKFLDKYINLPCIGRNTTGYLPQTRIVKIYKRFKKPVYIDYCSAGGTTPNIRPIISMISDSALPTNPGFIRGHISFNYKDV